MSTPRVFVSYAVTGDEQGSSVAQQLIGDLVASSARVVTDRETIPDEDLIGYLEQELPRCDYVLLVQTPQALQSLRVQAAIHLALNLAAHQRIKGVLRVVAVTSHAQDEQPLWVTPRTFDASQDYPRARDKVLLEMGLLGLDDEVPEGGMHTVSSPVYPATTVLDGNGRASLSLSNQPESSPLDETIADSPAALAPANGDRPRDFFERLRSSIQRPTAPLTHSQHLLTAAGQPDPALADRPTAMPSRRRIRRLWVSMVSIFLVFALVGLAVWARNRGAFAVNAPPTSASTPQSGTSSVIVDNLNDWSKVYSHTPNLDFDTNNSQWMHGDSSLLTRTANTNEEVVWKLEGMRSFQAVVYFWPPEADSPLSDLGVFISADDTHWMSVTPTVSGGTGNWIEFTYTLTSLSHVNFVKIRWLTTTGQSWAQQIGQVTLRS